MFILEDCSDAPPVALANSRCRALESAELSHTLFWVCRWLNMPVRANDGSALERGLLCVAKVKTYLLAGDSTVPGPEHRHLHCHRLVPNLSQGQ